MFNMLVRILLANEPYFNLIMILKTISVFLF